MKEPRDYLVWAGPVLDSHLVSNRAVSPAANRWQEELIKALDREISVRVLSHVPEQLWPRGRSLRGTGGDDILPDDMKGLGLAYLNLPGIRSRSLASAYVRGLQQLVQAAGPPRAVITYNGSPWHLRLGRFAQDSFECPWVVIVADAPGTGRDLRRHEREIAMAAGRVFLSWGRFQSAPKKPALHLDGGVAEPNGSVGHADFPARMSQVVLFAGALGPWAGSTELLRAYQRLNSCQAELWFCGHGRNRHVEKAAASDSRIRWLGMLSEGDLSAALRRASVLVNPRPPALPANRSNFPSKVLTYLPYRKPIVSTWTDGLAPEYREVLVVAESAGPDHLADAISRALAMTSVERSRYAERVTRFLETRRWSKQAQRLLDWMNAEIGVP